STGQLGRGWAYAVNTALDETGATLGPLLMALVLLRNRGYRTGFGLLLLPSVAAIVTLAIARIGYPLPSVLETGGEQTARGDRFTPAYWLYMAAGVLFAAGLTSFELISYHLSHSRAFAESTIPALLALATAGGVVASLVFGRLYDRVGISVVI